MTPHNDMPERVAKAVEEVLSCTHADDAQFSAKALSVLAAHDLMSLGFLDPQHTGPQAGDMAKACAILDAMAQQSGSVSTVYMVNCIFAPLCLSYLGTPEQKADLLPRIQRGQLQLAFALTEPDAGSDASAAKTLALHTAHGYTLRGEKIYITGSATADYILTIARTSSEQAKTFGVFLVPGNAKNLSVTPLPKLSGNECASCHIQYDGVEVAESALLGGPNAVDATWKVLRMTGALERLTVSATACGLARAATQRAMGFIKERQQFGQTLNSFQSIQHTVVEMSTLTTAMELMVENAIRIFESGRDATESICKAKYFCSCLLYTSPSPRDCS